jgi:glycosyltransferase involved in cell wall biosynthesis
VNLLLINYEYPPIGGGAGNATMFVARALQQLGHRATVLTSAFGNLRGIQLDQGVEVHRLNVPRREGNRASAREMLSFTLAALKAAPEIARRSKAEGVIVFFSLPCGPVALRLNKVCGLPYIVSLRGGDVPGLVPSIAWQHWLLTPLRRRVLRSACAIVANDPGLASLSIAADPFPVEVVHNGVDCEFYHPAIHARPPAGPTEVLFVGRFHQQKNLPFFLEQLAQLHAEDPAGWRLTLVGDGGERPALEAIVDRLNLGTITTWSGWQANKNSLRQLYQRAHVVVNPSLYEGMPNVVLEAMACGRPVIASNVPGNSSLVIPGRTGYLFNLGDGHSLQTSLRQVKDRPEEARMFGLNGRGRVEKEFSWDHVAKSYLALF